MDKNKIMLIVDDVELNRAILKEAFRSDFLIFESSDGDEAISLIEELGEKITIILLDIVMPKKDGFSVLYEMRKHSELNNIPVIMVTEANETETLALKSGAWDFITKPYNIDIIRSRVENVVSRRQLNEIQRENDELIAQAEISKLKEKNLAMLEKQNKLLQERMRDEERYRIIVEQTKTIVFEWNLETNNFYSSKRLKEFMLGKCQLENLFAIKSNIDCVHPDDHNKVLYDFFESIENGANYVETNIRLQKIDKTYVWCKMVATSFRNSSNELTRIIVTINVIDNEIKALEKLKYQAEYDSLTHIYNKERFYQATKELLQKYPDKKFVLAEFDIERFKTINDLFSREEGDRLLQYIGSCLKELFYQKIGTYGRIGSDVFCMCFEYSQKTINCLLSFTEAHIKKYDINFDITPCYGLYLIDDITLPVDLMCDRANLALRTVKGNYAVKYALYDENLRKSMLREQEITHSMKIALKEEQFILYLQPKYRIDTNRIIGCEVLVRWIHPEKGIISPADFIPIFERNGFIVQLDFYILKKACKLLQKWNNEGKNSIPISVNISRRSIFNPQLYDVIIGFVKKYNINPSLLQLEITESAYTDNPQMLIDVIKRLQNYGFTVMMDDFGSGYSSLNMLKDLPVDVIKVDLNFLVGLDTSSRGGSILYSVIRMAKWLDIPVITEGVETKQQADFLSSIGCNEVQGYYFAKPMPIPEFEKCLITQQQDNSSISPSVGIEQTVDLEDFFNPNAQVNLLFNTTVGAIGIYELYNNNIEIVRVNDDYYEMTGFNKELFYKNGRHILDWVYEEDKKAVLTMFHTAIKTKKTVEEKYRRFKADGTMIWLHTKIKYIAGDGDRSLFYASMHDITKEMNSQKIFLLDS